MFPPRNFMVSGIIFRSLIHSELICMDGVRYSGPVSFFCVLWGRILSPCKYQDFPRDLAFY